jgi:hypothetical protein
MFVLDVKTLPQAVFSGGGNQTVVLAFATAKAISQAVAARDIDLVAVLAHTVVKTSYEHVDGCENHALPLLVARFADSHPLLLGMDLLACQVEGDGTGSTALVPAEEAEMVLPVILESHRQKGGCNHVVVQNQRKGEGYIGRTHRVG